MMTLLTMLTKTMDDDNDNDDDSDLALLIIKFFFSLSGGTSSAFWSLRSGHAGIFSI